MGLAITDAATLLAACDVMHDADFDLDSVAFDPGAGTWSVALQRPDWGQSVTTRNRFSRSTSAPVVNALLSLEGVRSFNLSDRARIGWQNFNECRAEARAYRFLFHTDTDFVLEFDAAPRGTLQDGDPTGRFETTSGFGQGI